MAKKKVTWGILDTYITPHEVVEFFFLNSVNSELYAIANEGEQTRVTSNKFNIKRHYDNFNHLINDPNINAIYLPRVTDSHTGIILAIANTKKHILCRTNCGFSEQNLLRIHDLCEQNGVFFIDTFSYFNKQQFDQIKQLISGDAIGALKMIRGSISEPSDPESFNEGALRKLGCRCIHTINTILDCEPINVFSTGTFNRHGKDTNVLTILNYPNQVQALFDCSIEISRQHQYEIAGTKGLIRITFALDAVENSVIETITIQTGSDIKRTILEKKTQVNCVEQLSDSILKNIKPTNTKTDISDTLKVVESSLESLEKNSWIPIGEIDVRNSGWGEECGIAALLRR